jgi:hypothetical protein
MLGATSEPTVPGTLAEPAPPVTYAAAGATANTADSSQTPQAVVNRLRRRLPAVDVVVDFDFTRRFGSR